jgi:hypothetical protein
VYVQIRDKDNVGRVGYVDVDARNPLNVLSFSTHPVLDIGRKGCFDDNGVFQTSVVRINQNRLFMYYVGFELCHHIRYRLFTGVAISEDNGNTFSKYSESPALDRVDGEMFFRCGPHVLKTEDDFFRMWYVSGNEWLDLDDKSMPVYNLKSLTSKDGVIWQGKGTLVMDLDHENEHGFGRPYVVPHAQGFRMFFSIRKKSPMVYKLGYCESNNGIDWIRRDDHLGIDLSETGWDSESMAFPAFIETHDKKWLFYNGNDFGRDGFGLAELVED